MNIRQVLKEVERISPLDILKAQSFLANASKTESVEKFLNALGVASYQAREALENVIKLRNEIIEKLIKKTKDKHNEKVKVKHNDEEDTEEEDQLLDMRMGIGIAEIEDEIVKLLPEDLGSIALESVFKLKCLYDAIEGMPALDAGAEAKKGFSEIIKSDVLGPIGRLQNCILKKIRQVSGQEAELKSIDAEADEEIKERKSKTKYDELSAESEEIGGKIGEIISQLEKSTNDPNSNTSELEGEKERLLNHRNAILKQISDIEKQLGIDEIYHKANLRKSEISKKNRQAEIEAKDKIAREIEVEQAEIQQKKREVEKEREAKDIVDKIVGFLNTYQAELLQEIANEITKNSYPLIYKQNNLSVLTINEEGKRQPKKIDKSQKMTHVISTLIDDVDQHKPLPESIPESTRRAIIKYKTIDNFKKTLSSESLNSSQRLDAFKAQFINDKGAIERHRSLFGRTFVTAVESFLSLFTSKPVKFSRGAKVSENISVTLLGKRKEPESNNNVEDGSKKKKSVAITFQRH